MSDLTHQWQQTPDDPTLWACSCLIEHRGLPPSLLCPDRVGPELDKLRADLEAAKAEAKRLTNTIERLMLASPHIALAAGDEP